MLPDLGRNYVSKTGPNALDLYDKVLAADPKNQRAMQGKKQIVAFYLKYAQKGCDKQMYDFCKANAENGLLADPENAELKKLAQKADDASRGITPSGN